MSVQSIVEEGLKELNLLIKESSFYAPPHTGHVATLISKEMSDNDLQLMLKLMRLTLLNPADNDAAYWITLMTEQKPFWFKDLLDLYLPLRMGTSYPRGINRIECLDLSTSGEETVLSLVFWIGQMPLRDSSELHNTGVVPTLSLAKMLIDLSMTCPEHWATLQRASCKALLYADWLTYREDPYKITYQNMIVLLFSGLHAAMKGIPNLELELLDYAMDMTSMGIVVDPLLEGLKVLNRSIVDPPTTTEGLYLLGTQVKSKPILPKDFDIAIETLFQPLLTGTMPGEHPWTGLDTLLKHRALNVKAYGIRDLETSEQNGYLELSLTFVFVVKE